MGNNCVVCSKQGSNLLHCENKHFYHLEHLRDIFRKGDVFEYFSNCQDCMEKFFGDPRFPSENCIKCKARFLEDRPEEDCKWLYHICKDCLELPLFYFHKLNCDPRILITCEMCREKIYVKMLPELNQKHCFECMKSHSIVQKVDYLKCTLCKRPVMLEDKCCKSGHFYCTSCSLHCSWTYLDCDNCEKLFNDPITDSTYPTCRCFICNLKKYKIQQNPTCKKCYYCTKCINNPILKKNNCDCVDISPFSSNPPQGTIFCRLCKSTPEGTSKFCNNKHYICISCREFIVKNPICYQIILICPECVKEVTALKEYNSCCNENRLVLSLPYYTFPCGHRMRHDYLAALYTRSIKHFLSLIRQENLEELNKGFKMTCEIDNCLAQITVPNELLFRYTSLYFGPTDIRIIEKMRFVFEGIPIQFTQVDEENIEFLIGTSLKVISY